MAGTSLHLTLFGCFLTGSTLFFSCGPAKADKEAAFHAEDLRHANRRLLEVVMEDGFSPPQASRVYVHPHLAHFFTLQQFRPDSLPNIGSQLKDWTTPADFDTSIADPELSALLAFCRVGKIVVFTEQAMDELADEFIAKARVASMDAVVIDASIRIADAMGLHYKQWLANDRYVQTRAMDRYTSTKVAGHWNETPPDYTPALEPFWHLMRPLMIDSASAHPVKAAPEFSAEPGSAFHAMVREVLDASHALTNEQRATAHYWDDNPNISEHRGHLTTQEHRISPPGHWLNIVSTVTRASDSDIHRTTEAYALAAIAMYDALIACWHEKFRTDLVRPITYIQDHIDPGWRSFIQTPPFPEHPSGHSAVSAAAATVLDALYGTDHSFTDSTEVVFGMGARHFNSFQDAAWEVSLSRVYGGIHYMHAIREGNRMGRDVGHTIIVRTSE